MIVRTGTLALIRCVQYLNPVGHEYWMVPSRCALRFSSFCPAIGEQLVGSEF
jgi:hypothetical protein